ncbi:hypothetical protein Celaphus_00012817, partial [Cervus elaphus hippelaphus]
MTCLPPNAPSEPEAALMPDPEPAEALAAAPPLAPPEVVKPRSRQAPIPVTEASGQHFQNPAPAELPKLYPPLPVFGNRDMETRREVEKRQREDNKRADQRVTVLAAALGGSLSKPLQPSLKQNQPHGRPSTRRPRAALQPNQ